MATTTSLTARSSASTLRPRRDAWGRLRAYWLPRQVHPVAWWVWAMGLSVAASRTTNPLILLLLIAAAGYVVVSRRSDAPWSRSFSLYLALGGVIVAIRVFYRIVFGGGDGTDVLFVLPEIPLPQWAAGIRLFGTVTVQSVLGGLYDGIRLAAMVICLGAANALANPKRLLKTVPSALYDVGTALVVAVSVFPQLAESVLRVRRARRLRGGAGRGRHAFHAVVVPVLADALDRSLMLAAAMDSRGYGRHGRAPARTRALTGFLTILGLIGVCVGIYNVLDGSAPPLLALPTLGLGLALGCSGFIVAGRRVRSTRYRPDPFGVAASIVVVCGLSTAALVTAAVWLDPSELNPSLQPLVMPGITLLPLLAVVIAALPAVLTPRPLLGLTDALPDLRRQRRGDDGGRETP